MGDPGVTADCQTYDRVSPTLGLPLRDKVLIPNISLRYLIREYLQRHGYQIQHVDYTSREQQQVETTKTLYQPAPIENTTPSSRAAGRFGRFFQNAGKRVTQVVQGSFISANIFVALVRLLHSSLFQRPSFTVEKYVGYMQSLVGRYNGMISDDIEGNGTLLNDVKRFSKVLEGRCNALC